MSEIVLVTGGSGFVASWCIVELLRQGYTVRTTIRGLSKEAAVRTAISAVIDPEDRLSFYPADLTQDVGWLEAMQGCKYVLHVASPMEGSEAGLIEAAREGTLRVLQAAVKAGIERVVMTSSCAAITPSPGQDIQLLDETFWTDPDNKLLDPYRRSKTLSELAAWDFMKKYGNGMTLTTILPGAVFGPVIMNEKYGSVQVIGRMLDGKVPGIPRIGLEIIDVRDLADMHIRAMTSIKAAGERFIAVGDFLWMSEVAELLRNKLGENAAKVPTRKLPDFVLRTVSWFQSDLRSIVPMLGRKFRHTPAKAQRILGWQFRPVEATVVDCANSLLK
ncbi:SDR family oxidoreductase [Paenibacillus sp. JDR-2]|uniref:SDR family oxidoreductase n=1 Tax=Paenibacillus sp. (strain JDR-2) TaxID=324057 RepID=UPI00016695F4|nr:aldehyde reductase [Paenibacillus sp. JDR-2]ACT01649.1 NAD-dependent epimerase/dehydratase [Paenibacillus sp. JDR-2]